MKRAFWMAIAIVLLINGGALLCIEHITLNQKFMQPEKYASGWEPKTEKIVKVDEHWPWAALAAGGFLYLVASQIPKDGGAAKPAEAKH